MFDKPMNHSWGRINNALWVVRLMDSTQGVRVNRPTERQALANIYAPEVLDEPQTRMGADGGGNAEGL